jgi:hypothetical protein
MSASHLGSNARASVTFGNFWRGCKYISDKELIDKEDYWQPPEQFEQGKKEEG